jgi:hypothetical protein
MFHPITVFRQLEGERVNEKEEIVNSSVIAIRRARLVTVIVGKSLNPIWFLARGENDQ